MISKTILSLVICCASFSSIAQTASIYIDNDYNGVYLGPVAPGVFNTTDFNGSQLDYALAGPGELAVHIRVENLTGAMEEWVVSRRRINEQASWLDYLTFSEVDNMFGGFCIASSFMDSSIWTSPAQMVTTIDDGSAMLIGAHITPSLDASNCVIYRYYAGPISDPFRDSIDINVCVTLDVNELAAPSMSVAPNPVNDQLQITSEASGTLSLINIIGEVVYESDFNNEISIDVSTFTSGIYFAILESEGMKPVKEKICIE